MEHPLRIRRTCPKCGWWFEREDGYWLGAMTINMALVLVAFLASFGAGLALTWPDVPWTGLTVAVAAAMVVVPLLGFGHSRTIWTAIYFVMHGWNRRPVPESERLKAPSD